MSNFSLRAWIEKYKITVAVQLKSIEQTFFKCVQFKAEAGIIEYDQYRIMPIGIRLILQGQ